MSFVLGEGCGLRDEIDGRIIDYWRATEGR